MRTSNSGGTNVNTTKTPFSPKANVHTHHESHTAEHWKTTTDFLRIWKNIIRIKMKQKIICMLVLERHRSLETLPHSHLSVDILNTLPRGIPRCCVAEAGCLVTAWCAYMIAAMDSISMWILYLCNCIFVQIVFLIFSVSEKFKYEDMCMRKSINQLMRNLHPEHIFWHVSVCFIRHGSLIWHVSLFLCVDVCGPTETQRSYTHDWLHNSTPWVGSHPRGQKGSWVCTHSPIPQFTLLPPFSPPSSFALSTAAITVCLLHCKGMSLGEERG